VWNGRAGVGMGEAFTAVAEDASAVYWNPAAMSPVLGTNILLMHNEYMQSIRLEQVAITHETDTAPSSGFRRHVHG